MVFSKTDVAPRRKGRPRDNAVEGRDALVRAATTAFARHGFDGADLRSIAGAADVSANLVRVHFGSKAELWAACVDGLAVAMQPGFAAVLDLVRDESLPLADRLRQGVLIVAAFYDAYPDVRDFVARLTTEPTERAAVLADRLLLPSYRIGEPLIQAGIEAGFIRADHPALFFVLLNNALSQPAALPDLLVRLAPDIERGTARARLTETILDTLLHLPGPADASAVEPNPHSREPQ